MAFFGHAVSHAAVLGVAVGLALGINLMLGVVAAGLGIALLLVGLETRRLLASDTLIGILGHAALAAGLVALAYMPAVRMDLMAYLFGDVLAVSRGHLIVMVSVSIAVLIAMGLLWRPLLSLTVHEDLARVEGARTLSVRIAYMLVVALVIASGMQVVGALLMISLLIIPAAAARPLARTPITMAAIATAFAAVASIAGLAASFAYDAPAGPAIVLAASFIFVLTFTITGALRR
jgi:zinc transport system permease protein